MPGAPENNQIQGCNPEPARANLYYGALLAPRGMSLQRLFSTFPEGLPGIGLLLIRLAIAISELIDVLNRIRQAGDPYWPIGLFETLLSIGLFLGFLTPLAALAGATGYLTLIIPGIMNFSVSDQDSVAILLSIMSTALFLLGPGAYSLDASLFGRRQIIIPEEPHRKI